MKIWVVTSRWWNMNSGMIATKEFQMATSKKFEKIQKASIEMRGMGPEGKREKIGDVSNAFC